MITVYTWLFVLGMISLGIDISVILLAIIGFVSELIEYRREIKLHGKDDR